MFSTSPLSDVSVSPERGVKAFFKNWTIPIIGGVTPVMLIVVNIAVFVVKHLSEFRWTIAILSFVSGIMLNSWMALSIYKLARQRLPNIKILRDENQELTLVIGMGVVTIISFLLAYLCYSGLSDEANLPNYTTFLYGVVSIAMPILLQAFFRRAIRHRRTSVENES